MYNHISRRLEIKPGCTRSVHEKNGKGRWVVKSNGKYICVTGKVEGKKFIPDTKYKKLVQEYKPMRENVKDDNVMIKRTPTKKKSGDCVYQGEIRRISFTRKDCLRGRINWNGDRIMVEYDEGEWKRVV